MSSAKSWHNQALGQAQAKESIDAASRYGIIEAIKRHLAAGTDVNAKASRGWTPLHSVATKEVAELLIAKGADVNARGFLGITPLDKAVGNTFNDKNNAEAADLLRKHGGKTGEELKAEGK
jgi:ankyrin repeat protein